jgi:hypothetical protein
MSRSSMIAALESAAADTWIRRHRLILYFTFSYAISWPLWFLSRIADCCYVWAARDSCTEETDS